MENNTEIHTNGTTSPSRGVPVPSKGRSDKELADDNWIKGLQYSLLPEELKALPQWLLWRVETRENGKGEQKPTKVPFDAKTHKHGKATDPATWCDYATALRGEEGYSGLGFALAPPYAVVDLDKVYNPQTGQLEPWAKKIVSELNSYTERSPSGTGFHIWVKGAIPTGTGNRRGKIEIYSEKRYMTVTGDHVPGTPLTIEERDLSGVQALMLEGIGLATEEQAKQVKQREK